MDPLLSIDESARLLSISPWTVRAKIREGKLRPVRLGRRVLLEQAKLTILF
jgi:excisionase family DNA binding protein